MLVSNNELEFSHIEIRLIRNPKWLEPHEKRGWFLSEEFPIANFELPPKFFDMDEDGLDGFKKWFIPKFSRYFDLNQIKEDE